MCPDANAELLFSTTTTTFSSSVLKRQIVSLQVERVSLVKKASALSVRLFRVLHHIVVFS